MMLHEDGQSPVAPLTTAASAWMVLHHSVSTCNLAGGMLITSKKRGGAKRTDATRSNSGRKGGRAASSASRTSRGSQSASDTSSSSSDESSSSSESESESESDAESEKKSESESASSESENESEKPDAEDLEVVRVGARPTGGRGRGRGRGGGRSGGRGAGPRAAPPGPPGPPKAPRKVWPAPPQIHRYPPGQVPPEVMEAYRKFMANREAERAADKAGASETHIYVQPMCRIDTLRSAATHTYTQEKDTHRKGGTHI